MTETEAEADWLCCDDHPVHLLGRVAAHQIDSDRKLLLFAVGSCRLFQDRFGGDWCSRELEAIEQHADGSDPATPLRSEPEAFGYQDIPGDATVIIRWVSAYHPIEAAFEVTRDHGPADGSARGIMADHAGQCALIRDIFGNPYRPVGVDPSWLTSTVVALAEGIYQERAFDRLPILADALQDAGCNNDDVLNHCREPGEHVRGCWVVDLVLGKA